MNKLFFILLTFVSYFLFAQKDKVGINTETPSAMLDVVSKDNTNATKALEINNSSSTELMKISNAGNVGINIGTAAPAALLNVNSAGVLNIRHHNLPVLSSPAYTPPFLNMAVDASGNGVTAPFSVKYLYYQESAPTYPSTYNLTTKTGGFSLSNPNEYINIPIVNDADLKGNTAGFTFGTDVSATVKLTPTSTAVNTSNVRYIVIPEPGVYTFEFWVTPRCDAQPSKTYSLSGNMQVNTVFATETGSGSDYIGNTISRGVLNTVRAAAGNTTNNSYAFANPQVLMQVLQTTVPNQKVAIFLQYVTGDNDFDNGECFLFKAIGTNTSYYLIVTKM